MKNLKLNIALLVAMLATGITFTTQASFFGKRVITRCFTQICLKNAFGSINASLDALAVPPPGCSAAKNQVAVTPYLTCAVIATSYPNPNSCDEVQEVFCCATVREITAADPGFATTPLLDLGEGLKKYKVDKVYCRSLGF